MSVRVLNEVFMHSDSRLAARLVLLAIADNAEDASGIAYPPIVDHPDVPEERRRSIAYKAKLSEREVRDSLRELEELGELETRKAQRGRARINVYRVLVGYLRDREPRVEDLPFELLEPFATTGGIRRQSDGRLPAEDRVDHRQRTAPTTGTPTRARGKTEPSREPSTKPSAEEEGGMRYQLELALSAALGLALASLTRTAKADWDKAVDELHDVGATADEIRDRVAAYRAKWPTAMLTPIALVRHWPQLGGHVESAQPSWTAEAWVEKSGWMLPEELALEILWSKQLPEADVERHLARCRELRAERQAGDDVTRQLVDEARKAA